LLNQTQTVGYKLTDNYFSFSNS